jgi:ethylbenzene dioxygenase alpha subunit
LPGNVFKGQLNECNARAFYQRWNLLQAPTWADVPDRNGTLR